MTSEPQAILIDQARIDAPDFPRGQEWWDRFMPGWTTAVVRPDGIVSVTYNGSTPVSEAPAQLSAVRARRGFASMDRWVRNDAPRIAAGIIEEHVDDAAERHDYEMFGDPDAEPDWATPGYDPAAR